MVIALDRPLKQDGFYLNGPPFDGAFDGVEAGGIRSGGGLWGNCFSACEVRKETACDGHELEEDGSSRWGDLGRHGILWNGVRAERMCEGFETRGCESGHSISTRGLRTAPKNCGLFVAALFAPFPSVSPRARQGRGARSICPRSGEGQSEKKGGEGQRACHTDPPLH